MENQASFTIYKSSAGSGKTYTLVRDFLSIVLKNPAELKHTLAITFTNKATAEMKSRIIKALVEISNNSNEALKAELQKNLPEINLQQNAKVVLNTILHNYSSFSVTTIDSFFVRIIKALSRELGLPGKYDVEINRDAATDYIVSNLLNAAGTDKELTPWLEEFIFSKLDEDKGWKIERELYKIASEIFTEQYSRIPHKKIKQEHIKKLNKIRFDFENRMSDYGKQFKNLFDQNHFDISDFHYGKQGIAAFLFRIQKKQKSAGYKLGPRFIDAVKDKSRRFSKTANNVNAGAENELEKILTGIYSLVEKDYKQYLTATEILALIYVAGLTSHLEEWLKKYRDENNLFMLSDAGKFLNDVISLSDTPFIYEKTGSRYKHFLIDEFQDTSLMQWKNLQPLAENSLSQGSRVLTVGDVKQSIYRWRGGDMTLLLERLEKDLSHFTTKETIQILNTNYRSLKKIVEFNNLFFAGLQRWSKITDDYNFPLVQKAFEEKNVTQHVARTGSDEGFVSISMLTEDENAETKIILRNDVKGWKRNALQQLLQTINNLQNQNYSLADICVLVRSNRDGSMISEFLSDNGFPKIISPDSLQIKSSAAVNFILNCFRLIDNPQHQPAREAVSFFCMCCLRDENISADKIFSQQWSDEILARFFSHLQSYTNYNLYEMTEKLITEFFPSSATNVFFLRLLDLVKEFTDKDKSSLNAFIDWWDNDNEAEKISVILPPDDDSIRVSTVHRAKGLQYPVVIMPFFDWDMFPKPIGTMWAKTDVAPFDELGYVPLYMRNNLSETFFADEFEKECELTVLENINTMYVAFTRAEEKLYVFAPEKPKGQNKAAAVLKNVLDADDELKTLLYKDKENYTCGKELPKANSKTKKEYGYDNPEAVMINSLTGKFDAGKTGFKIRKYQSEEQEELAEAGIDVHLLLSKFILPQDEIKIADEMQLKNYPQKISDFVKTGITILKQQQWTSDNYEIRTECELATADGELLRPDRLMIKDKKAIVADFKTGANNLQYAAQVNKYADALLQMGFTEVEKYLVLLAANKAEKIT